MNYEMARLYVRTKDKEPTIKSRIDRMYSWIAFYQWQFRPLLRQTATEILSKP